MWNNNGFPNSGMLPNFNISNDQEEFPPSPFNTTTGPANGYFPQMHPNMIQFDNATGAQYTDFQPDPGHYNQDAFKQNQQITNSDAQYIPPVFNITPDAPPSLPVALNARAAELKQRLMKGKEARRATPAPVAQPSVHVTTDSSPSVALPKRLTKAAPAHPEQDLQELISSFSDAPTEKAKESKSESTKIPTAAQRIPTGPSSLAKSQELSLGSPKIVSKLNSNGNATGNDLTKPKGSRHTSRPQSPSDMSEGEILEDILPVHSTNAIPAHPKQKAMPPVANKKTEGGPNPAKTIESVRRPSRDEALPRPLAREQREDLPQSKAPLLANSKTPVQRYREERDDRRDERRSERRDSLENRQDRRPCEPEQRFEGNNYPEHEKRSYARRDSRDEEYRRPEARSELTAEPRLQPTVEPKRTEKARIPTLEELLPHDADVREWLEITGYHNVDYRSKILERRRKIAIIDAQREQLIAEMAAEEGGMRPSALSMAPPSIAPKTETPAPAPAIPAGGVQRELPAANKRPYSDVEPHKEGGGSVKIPRLEDRGQRVKDDDFDNYRPRSRGNDTNHAFGGRRDQRDSRFDDDRHPSRRSLSRDRENSPGRRAYENRPPARRADDDIYDGRNPYPGRGYDPSFNRGRGGGRAGRGRGGGGYQNDSVIFNPRGAHSKSFKDPGIGGYDKGRNGGM